ncbi:Rne/Rng family ribonuclease [Thermostichus vulcanus]|uniref:Rne/Rng family ribonuclease n=1 Tax=Thermostichus vulcanus str. 'Rupite' TaxID=2813851 RepID=A0ABT0CA77_THEVL|nr:Rne/Rng family ribonuclease [Thermostichus vulcanus]MCJ2542688.1 Rne/Rng family ribonuclease [Thermostichus vulcanus str. 'Rupite']
MPRQIVIAEQHRVAAVFAEDQVQELIVASGVHQVGDVYVGVIENVLPSIDAAFVNIGPSERNGFIHVTDLGPLRIKRSHASITELVLPQQKVLVQVMKEPTGNKGPRLTGDLAFPGRYLVLRPYGKGVHLSRRIEDREERNRLKSLAILIKPPQMGLLVRTEAEGVSEEAMIDDLEQLKKLWEDIQQQYQSARGPGLLNRDDDFIQRVLRDVYSEDVNRIVTDSPAGAKRVRGYLQSWNKGQMPAGVFVDAHREPTHILEYFRVNAVIRQALRPRVDLPSGGYIIIEPTEALTVIDVNSGSFTQSATSRETVLWTNCEAATEIARQLKLRNIAGVIVVDFIDMDSRRDQLQVLEHFNKALSSDKARPQVAQLSELGLVELTRKRQGQSLYEIFGHSCPTCEGLGILARLPGVEPGRLLTIENGLTVTLPDDTSEGDEDGSSPILPRDSDSQRVRLRVGNDGVPRAESRVPLRRSHSGPGKRRYSPAGGLDPFSPFGSPVELEEARSEGGPGSGPQGGRKRQDWGDPRQRSGSRGIGSEGDALPAAEAFADEFLPETASELSSSPRAGQKHRDSRRPGRGEEGEGYSPRKDYISSTRTEESRPAPARQTITVEMTPLQQRVYSELGLSPLLLLKQPPPLGRDTVVTVALPGKAPASVNTTVDTTTALEVRESAPVDTSEPQVDVGIEPEAEPPVPSLSPPANLAEPEDTPPQSGAEPLAPEPEELAVNPAQQSPAASRRRRSRSS